LTKFNRIKLELPKTYALDAACVGPVSEVLNWRQSVLIVKSRGRGSHQRTRPDSFGFSRGFLNRSKVLFGFQTGDLIRAKIPKGKFQETNVGRVAVRASGSFNIQKPGRLVTVSRKNSRRQRRADGYEYSTRSAN
jgi:hypothetical protein